MRKLIIASMLLLAACVHTPTPSKVLSTVEGAYVVLAAAELAYKTSNGADPDIIAEMRITDNEVYAEIVFARSQLASGQTLTQIALHTIVTGMIKNKDVLIARAGLSPNTAAEVNAAILLVQVLEGAK